MPYHKRPEEVLVDLRDRLKEKASELQIKEVILGEEEVQFNYPLLQIVGQPLERDIEGMSYFKVVFHAEIWIYHADLSVGHEQRTIDDMKLATNVLKFLHTDAMRHLRGLPDENGQTDRLIFAFVNSELPGRIRRPGSPSIITTRLGWQGESRVLFSEES